MKILYVITKGNWGGAQKYIYDLSTHLPKHQFDVVVACGEGAILPTKLQEAHITVERLHNLKRDMNTRRDAYSFVQLYKLFKKIKPDIVHLNSPKAAGIGAFVARIMGIKKIIYTVHGFAFNEDRPWWQKKLILFFTWLTILFSTDVICISERELQQALRWPFTRHKLHKVYNGIKKPHFLNREDAQAKLAAHIHIDPEFFKHKKVIGTIAELTNNKGLEYALEAMTSFPVGVIYIIIGGGELHEKLKEKITHYNLHEKVFLAGFMSNAAELLQAFDIFVLPSLKEGFPYVLLEAGYAGLPVVATDVGGISEIIEDAVTGTLITSKNPEAISKAITHYISHEQHAHTEGKALQRKTEQMFTVDNLVAQTIKVYMRS